MLQQSIEWLTVVAAIWGALIACSSPAPADGTAPQTQPRVANTVVGTPASPAAPTATPNPRPLTAAVRIGGAVFGAELAVTLAQRTVGLSGRDNLTPNTGMLFVFESGSASSFWMKGMRFPLDFIWISGECLVADITRDVPVPEAGASSIPSYSAQAPAAYNFEIKAGDARNHGIEIGDAVLFSGLPERLAGSCE